MSEPNELARAIRVIASRHLEGTTEPVLEILSVLKGQASAADAVILGRAIDGLRGLEQERGPGRPPVDDDAAVARINARIARGMSRADAIASEAQGDESAARRFRRKIPGQNG